MLCWGVLMHIPDVEAALDELIRVTKPGGVLVFEEVNLDCRGSAMRWYWAIAKCKKIKTTRTAAGHEYTCAFEGETLFWRHLDPGLARRLSRRPFLHADRTPPQAHVRSLTGWCLSEVKSAVHGWNRFWLRNVDIPQLAYHNILMFRKG